METVEDIKASFVDRVYGHVDDRIIEQYLDIYINSIGTKEWLLFQDPIHIVEDFKRFVSYEE